jgi:hypothetical protein
MAKAFANDANDAKSPGGGRSPSAQELKCPRAEVPERPSAESPTALDPKCPRDEPESPNARLPKSASFFPGGGGENSSTREPKSPSASAHEPECPYERRRGANATKERKCICARVLNCANAFALGY